jgi:hypothetical protein
LLLVLFAKYLKSELNEKAILTGNSAVLKKEIKSFYLPVFKKKAKKEIDLALKLTNELKSNGQR